MNADNVIEYAKDWIILVKERQSQAMNLGNDFDELIERQDILNACVDLAFNRTKEAMLEYVTEREVMHEAHDRMLETIEQTLQEKIKDAF